MIDGQELPPPVILVVEDDPLVRVLLVDFLAENGLSVVEACCGDRAIEKLMSAQCAIDLVVSDVRMPGKTDGFDLAAWIESHCPFVPVILTSGYTERASDRPGFRPVLPKPYALPQMLGCILARLAERP